jgi:hypothetical protein
MLIDAHLSPEFRPSFCLCRKLPHSYRIAVVGDSYAYGLGVSRDQALPSQLEYLLNARLHSLHFEVVNLGRPGLNIFDEWSVLRQMRAWAEYDFVVLCISSDDAQPWSRQELARRVPDWRVAWREQWDPSSEAYQWAAMALKRLVHEQRSLGTNVVVVFYEPVGSTAERALHMIEQVCSELQIPWLDLASPFRRFSRDDLTVSIVDGHQVRWRIGSLLQRCWARFWECYLRPGVSAT